MTTISVTPRKAGETLSKIMANLQKDLPIAARVTMKSVMIRIRDEMRKAGKPITYPVKWDSEKQRRAFFATNGFGRGIPTKRTDKYIQAWEVRQTRGKGGRLSSGFQLTNTTSYSKWVGGDAYGKRQSRIHQGRWALVNDVATREIQNIDDKIADVLLLAGRRIVKST